MKFRLKVLKGEVTLKSWIRWSNGIGVGMCSSSWEDEENVYTTISATGVKLYCS